MITNHRLEGAPFVPTPNMGGALRPELLVLHYTVSWPGSAVVRAFQRATTQASAHLVLDLDGSWTQMVPFDRVAWHAGKSSWKGRPNLNAWSLGIEIVNPGPVFPGAGGLVRDVNGRTWLGGYQTPESSALPPSCPPGWKHWAPYTEAQLAELERVCPLLVQTYGLRAIVGHSDVAPGRKFDPGPMLPMDRIRRAAFGTPDTEPAPPPSSALTTPLPTLRRGDQGEAVRDLQACLNARGQLPQLLMDGVFGPRTEAAVRDYQRARALVADGVCGPRTWHALLEEDR